MAKARSAAPKTAPKRGRPAAAEKTTKTLGYRVGLAYLAWLEKVAVANRSSISGLLDQAVVDRATKLGIDDPPPKRTA
jgi:hypothetical protein